MGYFRLFYYISYIFNTITRIFKRNKKFLFFLVCIVVFLVVSMYQTKSHAFYTGDYTYGDLNYALNTYYSNINIDFLHRLDNYNGSNKQEFIERLKNSQYSFFLFYGTNDGSSSVNGYTYNTNNLRIFVYRNSIYTSVVDRDSYIVATNYDDYLGVENIDIRRLTSFNYYLYYFDGAGNLQLQYSSPSTTSWSIYIPSNFVNYMSDYTYNYLYNNYTLEQIEILHEMDEKLGNVDETLQQQQEYLEQEPSSEDFSNSDLPTDSGVTDTTTEGLNNIFLKVYNNLTSPVNQSTKIVIPVPFTR